MKQILFESSSTLVVLCLIAGIGYAFLLYRSKNPWSNSLNRVLFMLRAIVTFLIALFLLGPIVRQISNLYEKPVFVLLQDNSLSVKEATDSVTRTAAVENLSALQADLDEAGYEVLALNLGGEGVDGNFGEPSTNIHEALRGVANRFEGRSIAGVVLLSDGVYTTGLSPVYGNYNYPVHTVGIGDTVPRADVMVRNVLYNKIAYEGNQFPLRVEVTGKGYTGENVIVTLLHKGKVIGQETKKLGNDGFLVYDFKPAASEQGIQRWDIQVELKPGERNTRNNRGAVFIEVVEGKKKILVVSPAPHPDIKALRSVISLNPNLEFILHIPGVDEASQENLQPGSIDLAIFHQVPDTRGRTRELFQRFLKSKTSLFMVLGQSSDLNQIAQQGLPLSFEQPPRQYDEVTPVINAAFSSFNVTTEANTSFSGFPPVRVHFGKVQIPPTALTLLFQKVGNLETDKPLLFVHQEDSEKTAFMLGEGLWRWRLHEFSRTEKTDAFDEVFGKLIQYLSTTDERGKFRSYTIQQQFSDTEPVIFESQVFNDIFEPVYGRTIDIQLTNEQGATSSYRYTTSPGSIRYPIGGLKEGVYRYRSSTMMNGQREEVRGQFLVVAQQVELQNLTADFDLLRRVSRQTGGSFYTTERMEDLRQSLLRSEARSIIRSEERYDSIINLRWIFFLLLLLVSGEWFLRKYFGSY